MKKKYFSKLKFLQPDGIPTLPSQINLPPTLEGEKIIKRKNQLKFLLAIFLSNFLMIIFFDSPSPKTLPQPTLTPEIPYDPKQYVVIQLSIEIVGFIDESSGWKKTRIINSEKSIDLGLAYFRSVNLTSDNSKNQIATDEFSGEYEFEQNYLKDRVLLAVQREKLPNILRNLKGPWQAIPLEENVSIQSFFQSSLKNNHQEVIHEIHY